MQVTGLREAFYGAHGGVALAALSTTSPPRRNIST
jgi:hypothetical protein